MMKKTVIILLSAVLLPMSCVRFEPEAGWSMSEEILFDVPVTSTLAKSVPGPLTDALYPQEETMGVFAFHSDEQPGAWAGTQAKLYIGSENGGKMTAGEFKHSESHNAWVGWLSDSFDSWPFEGEYNPYYWPEKGSLIFAGYSPYCRLETQMQAADDADARLQHQYNYVPVGGVSYDVASKTLSIKDYVVGNYAPMSRDEIMNGDEYRNISQSDLMYFLPDVDSEGNHVGVNGLYSCDVVMHHALSMVEFTVKARTEYDIDYVSLHLIRLKGVYFKGDFSVTAGENDSAGWTLDKSDGFHADADVFHAPDDVDQTRFEDGLRLGMDARTIAQLLIIPGETHDIEVKCHVIVNGEVHENSFVFTPEDVGITEWEVGKRYVYNLTLGLNRITFFRRFFD